MDRIDVISFVITSFWIAYLTDMSGVELVAAQALWFGALWVGKWLIDRWTPVWARKQ